MPRIDIANYELLPPVEAALRSLLFSRISGARVLLLEGDPGTGKTFLGRALASDRGWNLEYVLLHSWVTPDNLFMDINVQAVVSGDATKVAQPGSLLRAAEKSKKGKVVLILDEVDKTTEAVEASLLDFLESGIVPIGDGTFVQANLDNLYIFITSNGYRDLSGAFLRRCRRLVMPTLPARVFEEVLCKKTGISSGAARKVRLICTLAAAADGEATSVQEGVNFAEEAKIAESVEDLFFAAEGWASKGRKGSEFLKAPKGSQLIEELATILGLYS